jgi:hypothetical protein
MEKLFDIKSSKNGLRLEFRHENFQKITENPNSPEQKNTLEILNYLFSQDKDGSGVDRRSIIYADKFDLYFDNLINSEGILFKEFLPILNSQWSDVKSKFNSWMQEKREGYIIDVLGNIDPFESEHRFKMVTFLWITLANNGVRSEFIISDWIKSISDHKMQIEELQQKDGAFFRSLFFSNETCFWYDTYVIRILLRQYIDKVKDFYFPIDQKELQTISVQRLKDFIESRSGFDIRVFNNFYYNCWDSKTNDKRVIILDEANKLVKTYIDMYPSEYLKFVIRPKYSPMVDGAYVFEPFIIQYFKTWSEFESFLRKEASKDSQFNKMIKFFEDYKASNYSEFHLDFIPDWIEVDDHGNAQMKYFKDQTNANLVSELKRKFG